MQGCFRSRLCAAWPEEDAGPNGMSLTLHHLAALQIPLDWWESVALVQSVCAEAVRLANRGGPSIPPPTALEVTADGRVDFLGPGRTSEAPVTAVANLLVQLLPPGSTPVPLRLLALTAVGPTPPASLQELSQALEYFERPGRQDVVRGVFERVEREPRAEVVPPSLPVEVVAVPDAVELSAFESEAQERVLAPSVEVVKTPTEAGVTIGWLSSRGGQKRFFAALSALLLFGVLGATWLFGSARPDSGSAAPGLPASHVYPAVLLTPAIEPPTELPALANTTPLLAPAPRVASSQPHTGSSEARRARRGEVGRESPSRSDAFPNGRRANLSDSTATRTGAITEAEPVAETPRELNGGRASTAKADGGATSRPRDASSRPVEQVDEIIYLPGPDGGAPVTKEPIYSAEDGDVHRPVGIRPRFWYEPPPGMSRSALTEVEIVVSARGDVEAARVVAGPRSYFDGMFLSAVKAWKFQPATRNGLPVAYRQRVWLLVP